MTAFMECLYAYAQSHKLEAHLCASDFYQESRQCADRQEALLRPFLSGEALRHFNNFRSEEQLCQYEENAAYFQLGFSAALELLLRN